MLRSLQRQWRKPDRTAIPNPRWDLLRLEADNSMLAQVSRGHPFQCVFCDIIVLHDRKPRTKTSKQLMAELQALCNLGWRHSTLMVNDDFIGIKHNAKLLPPALKQWQIEHN